MDALALLIVLAVIVVALVIGVVVLYNRLVKHRNKVQEGWAQIDTQLQRRNDLIPNLVETVKGYASHERSVFEEVTQARAAVQQSSGAAETAASSDALSGALGRLFAVSENYPDLQASSNFLQLQEELTATENRVSFARQYYNDTVRAFNTKVETIPYNIVAGFGSFDKAEYFEVQDEAVRAVPKISF